jgi:3(or 17)beta-hydroxysteroid dehydrogenase
MGRVEGLVAIVTGGASGLGLADAELLAAEGARVVVSDIDRSAGEAAARKVGYDAVFFEHDVASEEHWKRVISSTTSQFGRLDILVNNAGIVIMSDLEETTLEQFRRVNAIMSEGVFLGCKHAIPAMARSGSGSIINMASTASHLGFPRLVAYSAAKGAVRSMTKSVAMHCQAKGYRIRCNSIHPATIETPMVQFAKGRVGQPIDVPEGVLPAGAIGAPSDVANMVLFLASNESRFITGAELMIDNGLVVRSA